MTCIYLALKDITKPNEPKFLSNTVYLVKLNELQYLFYIIFL